MDDNTFILGLEIFKKYFHTEIVKKKRETINQSTQLSISSCVDALIIIIVLLILAVVAIATLIEENEILTKL